MRAYKCGEECNQCGKCSRISRRHFLKQLAGGLALCGIGALASACAPLATEPGQTMKSPKPSLVSPTEVDEWPLTEFRTGDLPSDKGTVEIKTVGTFSFDASQVKTLRPDIFQPEHISLFDILVHLHEQGDIALDYHFDAALDTHVIDSINGEGNWWYNAYYSNGWPEPNIFRMDMYPYKNDTWISLTRVSEAQLEALYATFREEVDRLERNDGQVIIPSLAIRSPAQDWSFEDVVVTPHDVRSDVLQPGVVTALDALISLREQGLLPTLKLKWYEAIGRADPVDNYWAEQVDDAVAAGGCGFVYETGPRAFSGFSGSHIHIPADVRVTVSPEYALWFWICL